MCTCRARPPIRPAQRSKPRWNSPEGWLPRAKATGYVQGLRDMGDVVGLFCTPNQAPLSQVIDVVFVYLEKNPKDRHDTALVLINHALVKAFPCPAKK
ncbi:Rap1a/Tai family immunity protein [Comamonas piscis]|nr:Rap1a/Tai family immunity protein [Comamonas piscis]WSO36287.1 Rap1a/Tai family immunity protein [Comamonas piscis]